MKHVVILHGYGLRHDPLTIAEDREGSPLTTTNGDWLSVVWGVNGYLGRLTMALWLARMLGALLVITTGASRRSTDGRWEAEVIYELAKNSYDDLHRDFPHRFSKRTWNSREAYQSWLARITSLETKSKNTSECLRIVQAMLRNDVLHRREQAVVYNVSSPNHLPRVMRDAATVFRIGTEGAPSRQLITLAGIPSETNYGLKTVESTKVDDLGGMLFTKAELRAEFMREFNIGSGVQESE